MLSPDNARRPHDSTPQTNGVPPRAAVPENFPVPTHSISELQKPSVGASRVEATATPRESAPASEHTASSSTAGENLISLNSGIRRIHGVALGCAVAIGAGAVVGGLGAALSVGIPALIAGSLYSWIQTARLYERASETIKHFRTQQSNSDVLDSKDTGKISTLITDLIGAVSCTSQTLHAERVCDELSSLKDFVGRCGEEVGMAKVEDIHARAEGRDKDPGAVQLLMRATQIEQRLSLAFKDACDILTQQYVHHPATVTTAMIKATALGGFFAAIHYLL